MVDLKYVMAALVILSILFESKLVPFTLFGIAGLGIVVAAAYFIWKSRKPA